MLRCFSFSSITPHFGPRVNIYARSASESFARLFKGGGVQGRSPCPRSAERGTLFMLIKDQERGLRGKPYQGVSPFSFGLCVCAVTLGGCRYPLLPFDPISLVLAQRNGVEPPKKSAFLPRRLHHPRERYQSVVYTFLARLGEGVGGLTGRSSQLDAVGGDVGASSSWERRAGPNMSRGGTQKRVSLGLHPVSLRKSKEMGWNGQGRRGLLPDKTAHT